MEIKIISKPEEINAVEKLAKELKSHDLISEEQAKQLCAHDDVLEAHAGFMVKGMNQDDGTYVVEATIPEWVTTDTVEVIVGHLDEVVAIAAAAKSIAHMFKVLTKGLKSDFQNLWEKHNLPGEF